MYPHSGLMIMGQQNKEQCFKGHQYKSFLYGGVCSFVCVRHDPCFYFCTGDRVNEIACLHREARDPEDWWETKPLQLPGHVTVGKSGNQKPKQPALNSPDENTPAEEKHSNNVLYFKNSYIKTTSLQFDCELFCQSNWEVDQHFRKSGRQSHHAIMKYLADWFMTSCFHNCWVCNKKWRSCSNCWGSWWCWCTKRERGFWI